VRCGATAWVTCVIGVAMVVVPARADEPWLLSLEGSAGHALTEPQRSLFGPGASASAALLRPLTPWLAVGVRFRYAALFNGASPADPGRVDPGTGTLLTGALALRLRPLAFGSEDPRRGTGLFVEATAGGGPTGQEWRPSVEVGLGWGFAVGAITVSPVVRYLQIIQPSDPIDGRDARILLAGVELTFFDARPPPPVEPTPVEVRPEPKRGPPPDRDGDGIPDHLDECPDEPEDFDGFEDEDGCPDPDNDGDGIPDVLDDCPDEPEVVNGIEDEDGCPDEGLIELIDDRIVLEERVLFDLERSRVKSSARPVLDAIVNLWSQHPEWVRLRIEGHADVRGPADYNMDLSQRRARNVMEALIDAGIPREIIDFEGHGKGKPRDPGLTEEAHERNRRVEFVVLARQGEEPPESGEATGPGEDGHE
jgi:outer membrane protein OmpA-like peptidoglycan-associated protein